MTMNHNNKLTRELQDIWHKKIPISEAMGLKIVSFDNNELVTKANLAPNVNVHGTAFAGSLYSIQALTGWGMIHLQTRLLGLEASILIAKGDIDYASPVKADIVAVCRFDGHEEEQKLLIAKGKARFQLVCEVDIGGEIASTFRGSYAVKVKS